MKLRRLITSYASLVAVVGLVGGLAGCSPTIDPTTTHMATAPDTVKFYQAAPAEYEILGTVEVPITADIKWDEHGDCTPGFMALQAKAAALGANGILLMADAGQYDWMTGAGYKGTYYQVPMRKDPHRAVVKAIYVHHE